MAAAVRTRLGRLVAATASAVGRTMRRPISIGSCGRASFSGRGLSRLPDVLRYVRGIEHRLDRLPTTSPATGGAWPRSHRSNAGMPRTSHGLGRAPVAADVVELGWQLEELRVAVFAQPVGARSGVSASKLNKQLAALGA